MSETERDHLISNDLYDVLKFIALVFLPAVATLYFALAQIWHFPRPEDVVGTITVIDTFLGVFIKYFADPSYNKSESKFDGVINVAEHVEGDIANKSQALMKVVKMPPDKAADAPPVPASQ